MGYGTSLGTAHEDEISYVMEKGLTGKQLDDQKEINVNETSGDFQSRFGASDQSTMPLEASRKLTDALKQSTSSGTPENDYNTKLTPTEESAFSVWKAKNAPNDSGADYDLRGAFRAGLGRSDPDEHLPDTFKKPNHPTFSDQSQYAKYAPDQAGTWDGDKYIPSLTNQFIGKLKEGDAKVGDFVFGKGENDIRPALIKSISGMVNAIPDFMTAEPGSVDQIEKSTNLAAMLIGGPGIVPEKIAAKMADGTLGSFAGVRSLSKPDAATNALKEKIYQANNLELDGLHPDQIWDKTGFFRGADGRWRYEIDDSKATLKDEAFDRAIISRKSQANFTEDVHTVTLRGSAIPELKPGGGVQELKDWFIARQEQDKLPKLHLPDVLDHPELYKAYPDLKAVRVEPLPEGIQKDTNIQGHMSSDGPAGTLRLRDDLDPAYAKSVILHEVQHQIQRIEGFAPGGGKEQFLPPKLPEAEALLKSAKETVLPQIKEKGFTDQDINKIKWVSTLEPSAYKQIMSSTPVTNRESVKDLMDRASKAGVIKQIQNISRSEDMLKAAKEEAFQKYQRIMGEVEARNVQARMNFNSFARQNQPPGATEDIRRVHQINTDSKGTSMAEEPTNFRRAANDNITGRPATGNKETETVIEDFFKQMQDKIKAPDRNSPAALAQRDAIGNKHDEIRAVLDSIHRKGYNEFDQARLIKLEKEYKEMMDKY